MKTQRKVCGFDENDMKTYSCGRDSMCSNCPIHMKATNNSRYIGANFMHHGESMSECRIKDV